ALPAQTACSVSVSTTVARKPRRIVIDNLFENNSILKTECAIWLMPEPSRAPAAAAATFVILFLFVVGAQSGWLSGDQTGSDAKSESVLAASEKSPVQGKSYRFDSKSSKKSARSKNTTRTQQKK